MSHLEKSSGCPFKAATKAAISPVLTDSENKGIYRNLLRLGVQKVEALLDSPDLETLTPDEQLHVVSALAIRFFADYVRTQDALGEPQRLDDLLLFWEQELLAESKESEAGLLLDYMDSLATAASVPINDIEEGVAKTDFSRESSIILLTGINTLHHYRDLNFEHCPENVFRLVFAAANTHILDPRYTSIESARMKGSLFEKWRFKVKRILIATSVRTKGLLCLSGRITPEGEKLNLYTWAQRSRKGCALIQSGEFRFFAERELGVNDF
jgi:hypothetical protein